MIRSIVKLQDGYQPEMSSLLDGGGKGDLVPGLERRRLFSDLLSHKEDFMKDKSRVEDIKIVYSEVEEYLGPEMPTFDEFIEIMGRLYINGFEICNEEMETYGWGVYLGPSIMDHSCQPTAVVSFTGCRLSVTCLRDVLDLSQLFISYCDTQLPTHLRREKLATNYFFCCVCCKCTHSARGSHTHNRRRNKGKN